MTALRLLPELEDALAGIPGVRAVSVVTGPDATPTEVHVLASQGKPAKQVVRDVQSLAMASYGLALDHRIVSVVQIGDDATVASIAPASPSESTRPSLTSITVHSREGEVEIAVRVAVVPPGASREAIAAVDARAAQRRDDAVARRRMVEEDEVTGLFAAERVAALAHALGLGAELAHVSEEGVAG